MSNTNTITNSNTKHKQVSVDYFGADIEVDEGISDLLQMIWKSGFRTEMSCEHNIDNCIWICFELSTFKNIIREAWKYNFSSNQKPYSAGLYYFITNKTHSKELIWNDNGFPNNDDSDWIPGDQLYFEVSLRFNKSLKVEFINLWKETFPEE